MLKDPDSPSKRGGGGRREREKGPRTGRLECVCKAERNDLDPPSRELTFLGPDSRCGHLKSQLWKGPSSSFPWPPPSVPLTIEKKKKKKDGINISQHF